MDTLSVTTADGVDGVFLIRWKWWQSGAKQPVAGEIAVRLDESYRHLISHKVQQAHVLSQPR